MMLGVTGDKQHSCFPPLEGVGRNEVRPQGETSPS